MFTIHEEIKMDEKMRSVSAQYWLVATTLCFILVSLVLFFVPDFLLRYLSVVGGVLFALLAFYKVVRLVRPEIARGISQSCCECKCDCNGKKEWGT